MKILIINKYLYPRGGDAVAALATGELLSGKGHEVFFWGMHHPDNPGCLHSEYFIGNVDYHGKLTKKDEISAAFKILYSVEARKQVEETVKAVNPDLVHLNNFAHQISPSILHVFRKHNIPAVMTMHDYKPVCASYSMMVDGKPCELCGGNRYYFCFLKKCVQNSRVKSLLNTLEMYLHHKLLNIYSLVDIYISPSLFLKKKVREMGFAQEVEYLPNFIAPDDFDPCYEPGGEFCYFGRISKEKGLDVLLKAAGITGSRIKIIGTGPEEERLKREVMRLGMANVRFLGRKSGDELKSEVKNSIAAVITSQWYENNPRSVLEAFALGKPVLGARIGGIPELVKDGITGFTFEAGNARDLAAAMDRISGDKEKTAGMGRKSRMFVEENFNPEKHYARLFEIYTRAIRRRGKDVS